MFKKFLNNKAHTFTIARIAIVFQLTLTVFISLFLCLYLVHIVFPSSILTWLLCLDVTFVILHLSYRAAYSGPKVLLSQGEKKVLFIHSISSLVALCMTFIVVYKDSHVNPNVVYLTLVAWGLSLVSGVIFFKRKYMN